MNDKFFDLKKEKQDRMINAALHVFAMQGYLHASTDQIVKEAGISKGLLFHYFETKLGVYTFVYEYSARYMILELGSVSTVEHDLFEVLRQIEQAHTRAMREYPYMQQFLNRAMTENVSEALLAAEGMRTQLEQTYERIYQRVDFNRLPTGVDGKKVLNMMKLTAEGLMSERIYDASFQPDQLYQEICSYIELMKKIVGDAPKQ
ncbi:MAG: TetR/AcrR family transcriptional regulator [Lachnospiraceae bacterium]|nr:TetR/AcrR family transcriptional regulator [Lachnospiraceae bacterium]